MGSRGASGVSKGTFAVKYRNGSIHHIRGIRPEDKISGNIGHMYREHGTKEWHYSREPISNIKANAKKAGMKILSIHSKAANPKHYVTSGQRWKNNELKANLKAFRANKPKGGKIGFDNRNVKSSPIPKYKGKHRVVSATKRRESVKSALSVAKATKKDILGNMGFDRRFTGGVKKSDVKKLGKIDRKIKVLENALR